MYKQELISLITNNTAYKKGVYLNMFKWLIILLMAVSFLCTYRLAYSSGFERTSFWFVHPGLTDDQISKQIETFIRSGVNGVIIGGGGHHYLHNNVPDLGSQIAITRKVVQKCHSKGLKVCEHHSAVLIGDTDFSRQHSDWLMKDFQETQSSSIIPEYQTQAFCPNNPEFRDSYWNLLSDYIIATGVDAVMSDDASFYKGCSCKVCAAKWTAETGGDIRQAYKESQVVGSQQWHQWNSIHNRWMMEYWQWLAGRLRKSFPRVSILGLSISIANPWASQVTHATSESVINAADIVLWEIYNPADFYSWKRISAEAAAFAESSRIHNMQVYALPYADTAAKRDVFDVEEEYFMWGLAKSYGMQFTLSRVYLTGLEIDSEKRDYWLFEKKNKPLSVRTEPYAPVGIMFSATSRDNDPAWEYFHVVPYLGWAQACSENGVLWQAVTDETLTAGVPKHIKTLILPNVFSVTDKGLKAIERFVSVGGTLIATHLSGLYNENGVKCQDKRKESLEALFGVILGSNNDLKPADSSHTADVKNISAEHLVKPFDMYKHRYKRGLVIYIPGIFESSIVQNYINEGDKYQHISNLQLSTEIADLVRQNAPQPPVTMTMPKSGTVLGNLRKGPSNTLYLHLLNVAGSSLPNGATIPSPSKVVWSKPDWIDLRFAKEPKYIEVIPLDGKPLRIDNPTKTCRIPSPKRYELVVIKQ